MFVVDVRSVSWEGFSVVILPFKAVSTTVLCQSSYPISWRLQVFSTFLPNSEPVRL